MSYSTATLAGREKLLRGFFDEIHRTIDTFDKTTPEESAQKIVGLTIILATFIRMLANTSREATQVVIIPNNPFEPQQTIRVEADKITVDGDVTMVTNRYGQLSEKQLLTLAEARIPLDLIPVAQLLVALTEIKVNYIVQHGETIFERNFNEVPS